MVRLLTCAALTKSAIQSHARKQVENSFAAGEDPVLRERIEFSDTRYVWEHSQYFLLDHAIGDHTNNRGHWNVQPANARRSSQLVWADRSPCENHVSVLRHGVRFIDNAYPHALDNMQIVP